MYPTKSVSVVAMCAGLLFVAREAAADNWTIDKDHSAIIFSSQHFGAGYTYGMFRKFSGSIAMDKKIKASSVKLEIEAGSVFTGNKKRDGHLSSPDFLNAKQFPLISFKSTKVSGTAKSVRIMGELTLHGVTKKVRLKMKQTGKGENPQGREIVGYEGELTLKRSDFGMTKMMGPVSDKIRLILAVEAIKGA